MTNVILDIETTGLEPFKDRIVGIGIKTEVLEEIKVGDNEKELLEWFWGIQGRLDNIIGWNIDRFDLWFIRIRSIKHNVKIKELRSIDLFKILFPENFQRWKSLNDVSESFFGERKDKSGQMIQEAFLNKEFDKIKEYLKNDLNLTYNLYKRLYECEMIK